MLAILTLEVGRRLDTDRLIDMFWGETPPVEAKAALQTHISALRRLLGPDLIQTEGYGYRLAFDPAQLDAVLFRQTASQAREAALGQRWEEALTLASATMGLWRGRPYPELEDDDFARPEIARLEETHLETWELWSEALNRLGRADQALPELERMVVLHPYRERLWEQLMVSRYRMGRHAEALRAFQDLTTHLAEAGLEPGPSIRRLEERVLLHHEESTRPPHNLPAELTSFVGRETERHELGGLLANHRLVTVTGAGGSGKTRLAVRLAADHLDDFPDGCWVVSLADLSEASLVGTEVATTLGITPDGDVAQAVTDILSGQEALLLLDNCEHVLTGVVQLVRSLLEGAPHLKVLCTSRERLRAPGEVVYEVPPMAVATEADDPDLIKEQDATRLFVDRATLADPAFRPTDEDYVLVGRVCRALDGIPLAIELAAAKMRSFDLATIERRLADHLLQPAGADTDLPRHQTMTAAIAWSFDLLDEEERLLFRRLSVFRGGFDIGMVTAMSAEVGADSGVEVLEGLVEKSLVARLRTADGRYRLLEPVREFAAARLTPDEDREARLRHLNWAVDLADRAERHAYDAGWHQVLSRLQLDTDNLMVALDTAMRHANRVAVSKLASALAWVWLALGSNARAHDSLLLALDHAGDDPLRQGELRCRLSHSWWLLRRGDEALAEAERAWSLVEDLDPSPVKVAVLSRLANLHGLLIDRDPRDGIDLARAAARIADDAGRPVPKVRSRADLGGTLAWAGEIDEALGVLDEARSLAGAIDDPATTIRVFNTTFTALYLHPGKRRLGPRRLLAEMLDLFPLDQWIEWVELGWIPYVFLQSGEWDQAEYALRLFDKPHLDGYDRETILMSGATLHWMRGDLEAALATLTDLERSGINPRWYHDYYPLRVDVAADMGDVEAARAHATAYLEMEVDPSEAARKLGVTNPLVRAEVNAALASGDRDHLSRAEAALGVARTILTEFPPPTAGSVAMETPGTHLLLATAEISRGSTSNPRLWRQAVEAADFLYFRLYAETRLAESLAQTGDSDEARRVAGSVAAEAHRVGALGLCRLIDEVVG